MKNISIFKAIRTFGTVISYDNFMFRRKGANGIKKTICKICTGLFPTAISVIKMDRIKTHGLMWTIFIITL